MYIVNLRLDGNAKKAKETTDKHVIKTTTAVQENTRVETLKYCLDMSRRIWMGQGWAHTS